MKGNKKTNGAHVWAKTERDASGEWKLRTQTGAIVAVVGAVVILLSHYPYVLNAVAAVLGILGIYELLHALNQCTTPKMFILSLTALLICFWTIPYYPISLTVVWLIALILFLSAMRHTGQVCFSKPLCVVFCSLMIPFFYRSIVEIRQIERGFLYLIFVVLGCAINDVAAFMIGKTFGTHKLAPQISPGKTVEGGLGGLILSTVILEIFAAILTQHTGVQVKYGLLTLYLILSSIIGQFGDLAMSVIKRSAGIKDFGNLLPGHGGILDRFDSLLFAAPFAMIFFLITKGFLS